MRPVISYAVRVPLVAALLLVAGAPPVSAAGEQPELALPAGTGGAAGATAVAGAASAAGAAGAAAPALPPLPTRRFVYGRSVRGRPLVVFRRGNPAGARRLLVIGNVHGDEPAGIRIVQRLLTAPAPPGADLWLIPTANPDGTAAGTRVNARRVDLNRNWPGTPSTPWVRQGAGTRYWSGPNPASEPETRALLALTAQIRPRATLIFHQPLFGVDTLYPEGTPLARQLSGLIGLPLRTFNCRTGCRGTYAGWHNRALPGVAVTVEFGRRVPQGQILRAAAGVRQLVRTL